MIQVAEDFTDQLTQMIEISRVNMLATQADTEKVVVQHGKFAEKSILMLVEMAIHRGRFTALIEAWELEAGSPYPFREEPRWLKRD